MLALTCSLGRGVKYPYLGGLPHYRQHTQPTEKDPFGALSVCGGQLPFASTAQCQETSPKGHLGWRKGGKTGTNLAPLPSGPSLSPASVQ
jgi:hypothetical protein